MDAGNNSFSSPPHDSILHEARLLNSDLGRHSVKSNFSKRLTGRFYSNGSLERHALRRSSLLGMMERKRGLERDLQFEERRVDLLLERLREIEKATEHVHAMISTIERGVVQFQKAVRRRQALILFRSMQHELLMRKFVAQVFQCRYRGWKGRARAEDKREHLRQRRRDQSLHIIQRYTRGSLQRIHYRGLLADKKKQQLQNRSATTIQAVMKGELLRKTYRAELIRRHNGARNIQRIWRGSIGRVIAKKVRDEMLLRKLVVEEKPKRTPLHLRKYSTYGASNDTHDTKRRTSLAANGSKKRENVARRGNSDALINMTDQLSSFTIPTSIVSTADEPENDSIATTLTSLTNQTVATASSSKQPIRHRANPSSPSLRYPQRVMAPDRRRRGTLKSCDEVGENQATGKSSVHSSTNSKPPLPSRKLSLLSRKDSMPKLPIPLRKASLNSCKGTVPFQKPSLHSCKGLIKPSIPRKGHASRAGSTKSSIYRERQSDSTEVPQVPQLLIEEDSI